VSAAAAQVIDRKSSSKASELPQASVTTMLDL
jgi:hypothetical protein